MSEVLTTRRAYASVKPRMRGWVHLASVIGFAASGTALIILAATNGLPTTTVAVTLYVAGVLGLFGVSAVYHLMTWRSERARTWMRRLDHSMIFLLIAGTYTPTGLLALPQDTARIVLGVVWAGALGGMLLKLAWPHAPRWVGVPLYIALGLLSRRRLVGSSSIRRRGLLCRGQGDEPAAVGGGPPSRRWWPRGWPGRGR